MKPDVSMSDTLTHVGHRTHLLSEVSGL